MDNWIFPVTFFFLSCILWVLGIILSSKKIHKIVNIISMIIAIVSLSVLFYRNFIILGGSLFCFTFFLLIMYYGFDISWKKEIGSGIYGNLLKKEAITLTSLEPKGKIKVDDIEVPATTQGLFIPEGAKVKIVECKNKIVIVERCLNE
mgnify:CR=1 FL=1